MDNKDNELIPAFAESLKCDIVDLGIDITESTIDAIIDNPIVEVIPFVKVCKAIIKGGVAIRDRHLLKNTLTFLREIKENGISNEKLKNYKEKICKSDKKFEEELERVIILLDKTIDTKKTIYLGRLFKALIDGTMTYSQFEDYSELLDRLYLTDINCINSYWKNLNTDALILVNNKDFLNFERLSSNGIGQLLYLNEKNNINFNEQRWYGFDHYAQLFVNIITQTGHSIYEVNINNDKNSTINNSAKRGIARLQ